MSAPIILVSEAVLTETARLLASFAEDDDSEGVVYWFGVELGQAGVVTSLIVPNADTSDGSVRTSAVANAEAVGATIGTPLVLLGQAHSHPGDWVRHSRTDDRETFAQFDGALSVVVPRYGRKGMKLERCGIHRHVGGRYEWIPALRVHEHLRVIPGVVDLRRRQQTTDLPSHE